jgi:hypothetical protein
MLSAIGEMPTTQAILNAGSSADVVMAKQILDEVNKEVQGQGWHFNTEYDVPLVPDAVGKGAQGMVHCEVDVDNNDEIFIEGANGITWRFKITTEASRATGSTEGTHQSFININDASDVKLTTEYLIAQAITTGINHSVADALGVTARQVIQGAASTSPAYSYNAYETGIIDLDEYPTDHPDYMVDSSELIAFDKSFRHGKNILLTQDTVGASGNGLVVNAERINTPTDQLNTFNFGENGMRVGSDIGHITLGTDVARVDLESHNQGSLDPIMKYSGNEWKLYDKKERTFVFTSTVKASVVYFYDFIGLPHAAQHYITIKASRVLQDRTVGAQTLHAYSMHDEFRAMADLKDWEGETADHSIFDSYSTYRAIKRGPVIT